MTRYRVGVDIGGTFTDIVFLGEHGERLTKKVSSTVDNYATAIVDGLGELIREQGLADAEIVELLHGTTVASNAILELKGARTGLITTKGFRDVLEIRTLRMPRLYDLAWTKPPPLVERHLRVEIDERINAKGEVERPLSEADAARAIEKLVDQGVEAIAVCLIHSYLDPAHEQLVRRVAERIAPDVTLCISSEVLPEIKEYERTSTTVINAYVRPIVEKYLSTLTAELTRIGVDAPLLLMQSNGGLTTAKSAAVTPMNIIESGPAAGVVGVQALARQLGIGKAISFDMGGTTAKASLIENGELSRALEYSVGGGVMTGSRLLSGAGYTLKVPAIDLAEVGAGGGSIVWIDAGGALQIGPHSASASPGPVCYDLEGTEPTLTDANVVLGYINPDHLVGGAVRLNAGKARSAIEEDRAAARHEGRGGRLGRPFDRRLEHDPRDQGGFERARPRSPRICARRLWRKRAAVRRRDGRGADDPEGTDPAVRRCLFFLGPALFGGCVSLHEDQESVARRPRPGGTRGNPLRARKRGQGPSRRRRLCRRPDRGRARRRAPLPGSVFRIGGAGARGHNRPGRTRGPRRSLRRSSTRGPMATVPAPTSRSSSSLSKWSGAASRMPRARRLRLRPSCRTASSSPSRCGEPISGRSMAGAMPMSSTALISPSPAVGPASLRSMIRPASCRPARPRASTIWETSRSTFRWRKPRSIGNKRATME